MSNSEGETDHDDVGIADDKLPEDLQPAEDNPLAEGLDDGETVEGLLDGGKTADENDDDEGDAGDDKGPGES